MDHTDDESESSPGPSRNTARARFLSLLGILIALAGLAFVARTLISQWDQTVELLSDAAWGWVVAAIPVGLIGMTLVGLPWRSVMASLGDTRTREETLRWYFPGQLGKYVPGGIWPILGRGELAVRGGVKRSNAYTGVALSLACTYLAAALTALGLLPVAALAGNETGGSLWVLAVLPLGLAMLHPAVLRRAIALMERALSRDLPVVIPDYRTLLRLIGLHVPAWLMIGLATWMVSRAFADQTVVAGVMFAAVLSWIVGFVVIPVPGGLGVREAAFVAAALSLPNDVAATTAVVARLCFVVIDLGGTAIVVALSRIRRSPRNGRD